MFSASDARDIVAAIQEDLVHRIDGDKVQVFMGSSSEPLACASLHKSIGATSVLVEFCFGDVRSVSSRFSLFDLAHSDDAPLDLLTSSENLARIKNVVALEWVQHLLASIKL